MTTSCASRTPSAGSLMGTILPNALSVMKPVHRIASREIARSLPAQQALFNIRIAFPEFEWASGSSC